MMKTEKDKVKKKVWIKPEMIALPMKKTYGGGAVGTEVTTFDPVS